MRTIQEDTPPSSGDELIGEDDELIYLGHLDELTIDDDDENRMDDIMEGDEEMENEEIPEDHSLIKFEKHVGSVFCCDVHPFHNYAVTGGQDEKAYVWSTETGDIHMEFQGFKDSVMFVGFSFDGDYVAAADMMGVIKVWQCKDTCPWPLVFEFEAGDIHCGLWHFGARVLFFGTDSGQIYVFKIPSGETKVLQCDIVKVLSLKLFPDGKRLVAGYEDDSIYIWDIKTEKTIQHVVTSDVADTKGVIAIATHPNNNLIACISDDGKIPLILANGKMVGLLLTGANLDCLAFSDDITLGYLASGTLSGSLIVWDVARVMERTHCSSPEDGIGIAKLTWVKDEIISICLDGSIRIYNGKSGEMLALLTGHRDILLDFSYNVQRNIIVTASDDGTARVFKYDFNKENVV